MSEEAKQKKKVEEQKRMAREGQVFWGYNADGELAPLPKEAILGA